MSVINQQQGGYIDVINPYNNQLIQANANSTSAWATRASLFAQVTDNFTAQLSEYYTSTYSQGGPGGTTRIILPNGQAAPAGQTFTVPAMCVTGSYRNLNTQPLAVPGGPAAASVIPANAPCTPATRATAVYVRPGATYGPVTLGPYDTVPSSGPYPGAGRMAVVGSNSNFSVTGLTLNYNLPHEITATSITSYLKDYGYGTGAGGEEYVSVAGAAQTTSNLTYTGCSSSICRGFPLYGAFAGNSAIYQSTNNRTGVEEELRLTSSPTSRPISWVAGLFFSDETTDIVYTANVSSPAAQNAYLQGLYGPGETAALRYGVAATDAPYSYLNARLHDTELAGYGEGNYYVTSKLKLIAGVRISRVGLDYSQLNYGQVNNRLATSLGSLTQGSSVNVPITPKFGAQYQLNDTDMVYFTAAQGFGAGGVNPALNQNACGPYLANYGLTASTVPVAYSPDSVWSYELGSKFRALDNRLQVNVAAFRIDWSQIQATISLPCGQSFVTGGGAARSEGGELEAQFRPVSPLLLTLNLGYTQAYYVTPVGGINGVLPPGATASIKAGDAISGAPPPLQLAASAQYDFKPFAKYDSYLRADYTYSSMFASGPSFGSTGYNALSHYTYAKDQLNLRLGVRFMKSLDANIFAINVFDSHAAVGAPTGGRTCSYTSPDCSTAYTLFNPFITQAYQPPRRVGIQLNYRY